MGTFALLALFALPARGAEGALAPCPKAPHCVSSLEKDAGHAVEAFSFKGDPAAAWLHLKQAVASLPRTTLAE